MMYSDFQTTTHGKWILAGEHAVLRGSSALVFPIPSKELKLKYQNSTSELNAEYEGEHGADMHLLFWSVLEQGMHLLGKSLNSLSGHFQVINGIPIGVGMGASAALCVAMARWFAHQKMIAFENISTFAQELENLFHGKSSGLDVAGVSSTSGIYFKQGRSTPFSQCWNPQLYLSSCGQIGITSHCIQQVQNLWDKDPARAENIDKHMADSVSMAYQALTESIPLAQTLLADSINKAADCFKQWGLVSESLDRHMTALKEAGAFAVKPTGSGGGGFVVSLWKTTPQNLAFDLIAL